MLAWLIAATQSKRFWVLVAALLGVVALTIGVINHPIAVALFTIVCCTFVLAHTLRPIAGGRNSLTFEVPAGSVVNVERPKVYDPDPPKSGKIDGAVLIVLGGIAFLAFIGVLGYLDCFKPAPQPKPDDVTSVVAVKHLEQLAVGYADAFDQCAAAVADGKVKSSQELQQLSKGLTQQARLRAEQQLVDYWDKRFPQTESGDWNSTDATAKFLKDTATHYRKAAERLK